MKMSRVKTALRKVWASVCEAAKLSYWVLVGDFHKVESYHSGHGYVVDENGNKRPLTEEEYKTVMKQAETLLNEGKKMLDEGQSLLMRNKI